MKIAYFGYDFFYKCLELLPQAGQEVVKIFTYKADNKYHFNDYIVSVADSLHVPVQYSRVNSSDIYHLREQGCELLVCASYPYKVPILPDCVIRGINIHPTILPEGRGAWPLAHVILKGLRRTGVTIHKLAKEFDSGDILLQEAFDVTERENLESLSCKSHLKAVILLERLLKDFDAYWNNARQQIGGSYWEFPTVEMQTLRWDSSVQEIDRTVRAIGKYGSRARFDDRDWLVQDATAWVEGHDYMPGAVVHRSNKEIVIAARDGLVCLRFFEVDSNPARGLRSQ